VQRKPSAGWTKAAHGVIGAAARERGRTGWKAADVLAFKPKPTLSGAADAVAAIRTAAASTGWLSRPAHAEAGPSHPQRSGIGVRLDIKGTRRKAA
jgi:hypothetical protein